MAFLAARSREFACIIVTYRTTTEDVPVYVVSSANSWTPEPMQQETTDSDVRVKLFKVPSSEKYITYKFRVGDAGEWFYDHDCPTEPDGYGGMNNRFNIPATPITPPPEASTFSKNEDLNESLYLEPNSQTALPSPVASPRDAGNDSGTEIEAPSISDWEPTSDSEIVPTSPFHAAATSTYAMSETTDWEVL